MPDIEASVWQPYKDQGVLVYAVHSGDDPSQLSDFVAQTGITYPVIFGEGTLDMFSFPGGFVGYPYPRDIVIGKDRRIHAVRNTFDPDEMVTLVEQLLAE